MLVSGRLRYANNSNYKNDTMIRKEVCVCVFCVVVVTDWDCFQVSVNKVVMTELKRIIQESEVSIRIVVVVVVVDLLMVCM